MRSKATEQFWCEVFQVKECSVRVERLSGDQISLLIRNNAKSTSTNKQPLFKRKGSMAGESSLQPENKRLKIQKNKQIICDDVPEAMAFVEIDSSKQNKIATMANQVASEHNYCVRFDSMNVQ